MIYFGFDKDGTLELPELAIPYELKLLLQNLSSLDNVSTFLSSGRSVEQLQLFCDSIQYSPSIISGENGGHFLFAQTGQEVILDDISSDLKFFKDNFRGCIEHIDVEPRRTTWTSFFGGRMQDAYNEINFFIIKHNLDLKCYLHQGLDGAIDVVSPLINKSNILKYLPHEAKIFYFGDNVNDMEIMCDERVIPCTFTNATSEIKQIVKNKNGYFSDKIAGHGVFEILNLIISQYNLIN